MNSLISNVAVLTTAKVKDNKTKQVVNNLQQLNTHLQRNITECIAGACFISATKKGSNSDLVGRLEIFPSGSARDAVQESQEYKSFNDPELYEDKDTITLWRPAGGFLSRKNRPVTNAAVLILAKFTCINDKDAVQHLVKELQTYCDWVESNEITTFTYCVMINQAESKEVLLFERYMDLPSVKTHSQTNQFKSMSKHISPWIEANRTEITRWNELDGSFFSSLNLGPTAKL
ncbi:hypothetical protein V8C35DRAFT_164300 [Trichoderma chlorosporum]